MVFKSFHKIGATRNGEVAAPKCEFLPKMKENVHILRGISHKSIHHENIPV